MFKKTVIALIFAAFAVSALAAPAHAEIDWRRLGSIDAGGVPVDVAISPDGRRTFILIEGGDVLVYLTGGKLEGRIKTGVPATGLEVSPMGNRLLLVDRGNREITVVEVEFSFSFDLAGSPIKGPAGAPVTVTVFNDFQ